MQRVLSAEKVAVAVGGPLPAPKFAGLTERLRGAITDGRLPAGARLPSERELVTALGLSRTTVTRAYAELRRHGYVQTRQGSGSIVHLPMVPGGRVDHLLVPAGADDDTIDLRTTASRAGPWLQQAYLEALDAAAGYLPGVGYYPTGLPVLRDLVAREFTDRGVATSADQILITGGAIAGTAIAISALLGARRSGRVVMESPTYPNAIATLRGLGARIVPHPVDQSAPGAQWDPGGLETLLHQVGARVTYLVPDFHNPTGALMDTAQREHLGAVLQRAGTVPIIDETPVELAGAESLQEAMPPPLAAFVTDSITVGGVSKSFWGGLRIGWMRVPRARVAQVATSRLKLDLGAPVVEQLVVASLLRRRAEILPPRRTDFAHARDVLLTALREHLPTWQVRRPPGGLSLWCELPQNASTSVVLAAARHGVSLASGPNFAPTGGLDQWLRLPYVLPPAQLHAAVDRLKAAWHDTLDADPRAQPRGIPQTPPLIA